MAQHTGKRTARTAWLLQPCTTYTLKLSSLLTQVLHVLSLPPGHLLGLLDEVVTNPARDGDDGHGGLDEGILPADTHQAVADLISNLLEALLLRVCVCV